MTEFPSHDSRGSRSSRWRSSHMGESSTIHPIIHMKRFLLPMLPFLAVFAIHADDEEPLKLEAIHAIDGRTVFLKIRNDTESPVSAFRATLFVLNDFDEAKQLFDIEFSRSSQFQNSQRSSGGHGHVIQPGETIFCVWRVLRMMYGDDRVEQFFITDVNSDKLPPPLDSGRFILQTTKLMHPPAHPSAPGVAP